MPITTSSSQLRLLDDQELDREFADPSHDEATRNAILYEKVRRLGRTKSGPHWTQWVLLALGLGAVVLAGIAAFPVLDNLGDSWLDF